MITKVDWPILVFGCGPGGGKDFLTKSLLKMFPGLKCVGIGDMLRKLADSNSPDAVEVKETQARGDKVPGRIVLPLIREEVRILSGPTIFDGLPRTDEQTLLLANLDNPFYAIQINRDHEFRFNKMMFRRNAAIESGGKPRPDDNPETFAKRSREFENEELPAFNRLVHLKKVPVYQTEFNAPRLDEEIGRIIAFHSHFFCKIPKS